VHQLKETLGKEEFQASEDQLLSLYEEIKDQYYKKSDYIKVQKVMLDHIDDDSLEEMKQVKADLDADYGWEKSVSRLSGNGILSEQIFNVNSARVDEEVNPKLYAAANRLHAGQISEVIEENQNLFLIVCLERRDEGYQSFSEVKQNLMSLWIDQKYDEKLA
ncbi:peptidyl-prolyl cis-trans isomerase, partial [Paenibacillus sp. MCAF20]